MKKCSSFSQNRKLVVIIVSGAFFIVEEVLSNCRSTGWIEISHNLFEHDFLLLSVYAVLFYPAVFEMCGLRTDNHSGTRIGKRPYFVAW